MTISEANQQLARVASPNTTTSYEGTLESQKELFIKQMCELHSIVLTQCKLTGFNPLSQEMAAGALSIKIAKRPRALRNPKAIKYMQSIFSVKDEISKKEMRAISAVFGLTATQVRDFFTGQRSRVRRFIRLSREKGIQYAEHMHEQDGFLSFNPDIPSHPVPLSSIGPSGIEAPSCSMQDEAVADTNDSDKYFIASIFTMLQKEETFSGQVKLMEWILKIQNASVLYWFLTNGGVMILLAWLSEAAIEEQTSVLHVILRVLCHLPLHKAIPAHMSAVLQSLNKLQFYQGSDISNRAKNLLSRWSKMFARSEAMRSESLESIIDNTPGIYLLQESAENFRILGSSQSIKLLTAPSPSDDSDIKLLREKRKLSRHFHKTSLDKFKNDPSTDMLIDTKSDFDLQAPIPTRKLFKTPTRKRKSIGEEVREKKNVKTVKEAQAEDSSKQESKKQKTVADKAQSSLEQPEHEAKFHHFDGKKISPRNNPSNLIAWFKGLSEEQQKTVEIMGFGSLLKLQIHGVPTGLGYWLIVNYDEKTNNLNLGTHFITLTPSIISSVLGIPDGTINVNETERPTIRDPVVSEFRSQFKENQPRIYTKPFLQHLAANSESNRLFMLNFLVAVFSVLGEITKNGTVNQRFLNSLKTDADIPNLGWARYLLKILNRTKKGWMPGAIFGGPLLLLSVVYANDQIERRRKSIMSKTPVEYFTTEHLANLEQKLEEAVNIKKNGRKRNPDNCVKKIVMRQNKEMEREETMEEIRKNDKEDSLDKQKEEMDGDYDDAEQQNQDDDEKMRIEELNKEFREYRSCIRRIQAFLEAAQRDYPDSDMLKAKQKEWNEIRKTHEATEPEHSQSSDIDFTESQLD